MPCQNGPHYEYVILGYSRVCQRPGRSFSEPGNVNIVCTLIRASLVGVLGMTDGTSRDHPRPSCGDLTMVSRPSTK